MDKRTSQACASALWLLYGGSLAKLLRAHGADGHADKLDEALDEVSRILGEEMGSETWRAALDWASEQAWAERATTEGAASRH
jgi:hypothetical protein